MGNCRFDVCVPIWHFSVVSIHTHQSNEAYSETKPKQNNNKIKSEILTSFYTHFPDRPGHFIHFVVTYINERMDFNTVCDRFNYWICDRRWSQYCIPIADETRPNRSTHAHTGEGCIRRAQTNDNTYNVPLCVRCWDARAFSLSTRVSDYYYFIRIFSCI